MLTIKVSVTAGTSIDGAVAEAQRFAGSLPVKVAVEFDFNGIRVRVYPGVDPERVIREYHEDMSRSLTSCEKGWWHLWG